MCGVKPSSTGARDRRPSTSPGYRRVTPTFPDAVGCIHEYEHNSLTPTASQHLQMAPIFLAIVAVCFQSACAQCNRTQSVLIPAEWRVKQSGTWMGWPIFESIPGKSVIDVVLEMMAYITSGELDDVESDSVYLAVTDGSQENQARGAIKNYNDNVGIQSNKRRIVESRIIYRRIPRTDIWFRDYLLFGINEATGGLVTVDYDFNAWGMGGKFLASDQKFTKVSNYFNAISKVDSQVAPKVAMTNGITTIKSWLRTEAGGFEYNDDKPAPKIGKGSSALSRKRLIVSEAVLTQPERNFGATIYQIRDEIKRLFRSLDDIILLPKFRFDHIAGKEIMEPPCPVTESEARSNMSRWSQCLDSRSNYYLNQFGGGLVVDDSVFSGTIDNEDDTSRRTALGANSSSYMNALTAIPTNGHTDEYVRWVGENTVLLAYVPNGSEAPSRSVDGRTHFRLEKIRQTLVGRGIEIIGVPTAKDYLEYLGPGSCAYDSVFDMKFTGGTYFNNVLGKRVPAKNIPILSIYPEGTKIPFYSARSYLNFVITDKFVLMPKYNDDTSRDRLAYDVIKRVFEIDVYRRSGINRTVVQIENVDRLNLCGGGMHCITQNQPQSFNTQSS